MEVKSADGDARDLVRMLVAQRMTAKAPIIYLAGEDRAADLVSELSAHGIGAEMRTVYRSITAPFPLALVGALTAGEIDAVLHFSRRSAENYVDGAKKAGIAGPALAVRQLCLSAQVAEPLAAARPNFRLPRGPTKPHLLSFCRRQRLDYWHTHAICVISCLRVEPIRRGERMADKRTHAGPCRERSPPQARRADYRP